MKACPLTFSHPSEAQQLDGIGPKICDRLTEKLKEHCEANGLPQPKKPRGKARKRLSTDDLADVEEPAPTKKPRRVKQYIPTLRSGPYALLLALSSVPEDSLQSLTKAQVIELAQPYCDSSFTVPSEAGKFYTAWNSMTTLVNKDLVQERGRPLRKYTLSEEGWEVARSMRAAKEQDNSEKAADGLQNAEKTTSTGCTSTAPVSKMTGQFLDLGDSSGQEESSSRGLKISKGTDRYYEAAQQRPEPSGRRLGGNPVDKYGTLLKPRKPERPSKNIVELLSSPEPELPSDIPWATQTFNQDTRPLTDKVITKPPNKAPVLETTASTSQNPNPTSSTIPTFTPITLQPGTFTIHLVLDNREVRSKDDRDYISTELTKKGAPPLLRPLPLGDFLWVAKLHSPTFLSHHGEEAGDEVTLSWIVERKRLDDLIGSITDGRFQEQKFRLRKSGIKNVIYLIEEFSLSAEKSTKFHEAIQSAIASTQVVNNYFVKRTLKLDDSIRYLARLTKMLKSLYETEPLHLIPTSALTPTTYLPLLKHLHTDPAHRDNTYTITYPSFASLASKSDTLTLRDVFLKMLMCTRGISGDKALAIQKIWSTPKAFIEAFEKCESQKEREMMVEGKLGGIVGRGKVKGVLGAKVAGVWGEE